MPRVRIGPAFPDHKKLAAEITRLRDLGNGGLRKNWHAVFGRLPPPHLPRHLLFRILAYRLQADRFGDLDGESKKLLDRSESPEKAGQKAVGLVRCIADVRPGTVLGREWNGRMQRGSVQADCQTASKFDRALECAPDGGQIAGWELTGVAGLSEDESHGQAPHP
jgi:hypothetical protein